MRSKILFFFYMFSFQIALGQGDSLILDQDQLTEADLFPFKQKEVNKQVVSLFGRTEEIADLPFSAYVITKEEIRDNGYVTLVDALRTVPGIFTSKNGSATEGETFMMHGIRGNRRAEILINGMSIKAFNSIGMQIGAQIPIRQAERIEVYFESVGTRFAVNSGAGVINIVLTESERPVFTGADLSFGPFLYNNIDVTFGGKLGRGKNLMRFVAWGSSTTFESRNNRYLNRTVQVPGLQSNLYPQYFRDMDTRLRGLGGSTRREMPHSSRQYGFTLNYKKLELLVDYRWRQDFVQLGMDSYRGNDTSLSKGESTIRGVFRRKYGNKRVRYSMDASLAVSEVNDFSSYELGVNYATLAYEENQFTRLEDAGIPVTIARRDSIININRNTYLNNLLYTYGISYQAQFHNSFLLDLNRHQCRADVGFTLESGIAEFNLLTDRKNTSPNPPNPYVRNRVPQLFNNINAGNAYAALSYFYSDGKFRVNATGRVVVQNDLHFLPNFGISYKVKPNFILRSSYTRSISGVGNYYRNNTYHYNNQGRNDFFNRSNDFYPSSIASQFQLGFRANKAKRLSVDLFVFQRKTTNLLFFDVRPSVLNAEINGEQERLFSVGYYADGNYEQSIRGAQISLLGTDIIFKGLDVKIGGMLGRGRSTYPNSQVAQQAFLSHYPAILGQSRFSYKIGEKWYFAVENFLKGNTQSIIYPDVIIPWSFITDITGRRSLSRHFQIYFKINNLFNRPHAGIAAFDNPDALLYNPQSLFLIRIGVSYNLN